jgi:hypothetical protein
MKHLLLASATLAAALPVFSQDYSYGRIRHVEGGTTLQRGSEAAAEEAFRNLPFLPGDRIWTDDSGRAEFQFASASIVRMGARGKLDYVANEGERDGGRVVLRVWSGALMLRSSDGRGAPEFEIETPAGMLAAQRRVIARIDTGYNETRIGVYEGSATLDDGQRRTAIDAGEELVLRRGEEPGRPRGLTQAPDDEFARWDADRERQIDWAGAEADERYLPEEVAPFAPELRNNGSWHFSADFGYVWQPHVAAGWQPYSHGRWVWSSYGWTWVPNEIWGWAPSHYALGWYWMPGNRWSPAWVSWSHSNDYLGWCAMGRGDRPASYGHAVPRGGATREPWNYTRHGDLTSRDLARRRVPLDDVNAREQRVVERGHIDRSGRVAAGEVARPRNVQTRPTPGDTIQELRADPMTTIPFPVARRRYPSEDERREREGKDLASVVRYAQTQPEQSGSDAEKRRGEAEAQRDKRQQDGEKTRPTTLAEWLERRRAAEAAAGAGSGERDKAQERDRATTRERERAGERRQGDSADRDVMRKVFGPISGGSRGKDRDSGDSGSSRDSSAGRDRGSDRDRDKGDAVRSQPRRESPREASPPPREDASAGATARRKRDQNR